MKKGNVSMDTAIVKNVFELNNSYIHGLQTHITA